MAKSKIQEYASLEQQIRALTEKRDSMQGDPGLQTEIEFKDKLEKLMKEYEKTASDVMSILSPEQAGKDSSASTGGTRRKRKLKVYENPNTGETLKTRGGNNKILKAWKEENGAEVVEGWLVREED